MLRNSYGVDPTTYQQSFRIKDEQDVKSSGMLEKGKVAVFSISLVTIVTSLKL